MPNAVKSGINVEVTGASEASKNLETYADSVEKVAQGSETAATNINAMDKALQDLAKQKASEQRMDNFVASGAKVIENAAGMAERIIKMGDAFISAASDAAEYADAIGKAAERVGFSNQAYQEWDYILKQNGTSMNAASSGIIRLMKAQQGLTKTAEDDFRKIGLSLEEVKDLNSEELFATVIEHLQQIPDASERTLAATALLGQGIAKNLGPVLDLTAEETKNLREQVHALGGVLSDEQIVGASTFNDTVDNLRTRFNGLKREVLLGALPALTDFTEKLASDESVEKMSQLVGTLSEKVAGFAEYLADHSDAIITAVEGVGVAFVSWKAAEVIKTIVSDAKDLVAFLGQASSLLGISGAATAAGIGGIGLTALGAKTVADRFNELKSIGTIGDGHELAEYAENVAYLEQELEKAQARFDELASYGGDLTMAQDEIGLIQAAIANAKAEAEAMQAAKEAADAAGPDPTAQAEQAVANVKAASGAAQELSEAGEVIQQESEKQLQAFSERTDEITSTFVEGTDEMSQAAVEGIQQTQNAMETNMAILNANAEIWGDDMMRNMANGILGGANKYVVAAVETVAKAIEERLGFSEPDKGPLADFHTFAPDMMQLFAQGIREGQGLLDAAIGDVFDLGPLIAAQNGGGQNFNYGGVNVTIYGAEGQSADELYDVFSRRLAQDVADREAVFSS